MILTVLLLESCNSGFDQKNEYVQLEELILIDSVLIEEKKGFLARPSKSTLLNDTLIAIESMQAKGIWIINRKNGKEETSLLDKSIMGVSFFISNSDWSNYPEVYILDGLSSNVYHLNLEKGKNETEIIINKIPIQLPQGFSFRVFADLFWFRGNEFYIELSPDGTRQTSIDFYKKAGKFIGVFDLNGNFKYRFLDYPPSLTNLKGFIEPTSVYSFGRLNQTEFALSFPSERHLLLMDSQDTTAIEKISFPKSQYFEFEWPYLEEEVSHDMAAPKLYPTPHRFGEMIFDKENLYLQSFMKDNVNFSTFTLMSHIMKYNFETKTWIESRNPKNFLDLGRFAGVLNDTLYFVEASVMNRNEKYIKRAVLKPIDD
ncbi:hypothetical protein [Algoriphagus sp.]|uniref:hypothetical protein n=1 Tax=Algoriphagus sp. TaxID=1872435 RepID=UPI0039191FCF